MKKYIILFFGLIGSPIIAAGGITSEQRALSQIDALRNADQDPALAAKNSLLSQMVDPLEHAADLAEMRQEMVHLGADRENQASYMRSAMQAEDLADTEEEAQKEIDHIKWQNTLLTTPGSFVGIYKGDAIKIGLLVTDIFADMVLYKELSRRHKDHIYDNLTRDTDEVIALLKRVRDSESRYEERMSHMSEIAKIFTDHAANRDTLLNPMRRFLDDKHNLVPGLLPLNSKTFVPLIARFGWEKISSWMNAKLLVKSEWAGISGMKTLLDPNFAAKSKAQVNAYQPNHAGYLKQLPSEEMPFGLATLLYGLTFFVNPARSVAKLAENIPLLKSMNNSGMPLLKNYRIVNIVGGFGIPSFFFSDMAQLGLEVTTILYAAKKFEKENSNTWKLYVIENRHKLLKKLEKYQAALNSASEGEESLENAKKSLRKFIDKGHKTDSWIPGQSLAQWWAQREEGKLAVSTYLLWGSAALLAMKAGHWWYTFGQ